MRTALRVLVTLVAAVATFYFAFWVGGALLISAQLYWLSYVASILVAIVVARYVWVHTDSLKAGLIRSMLLWALVTGAVAFSAGFFGPIVLTPEANQGPLLGIFITGPLGFILGAVAGAVYWLLRRRRASVNDDAA
jgi:hypothetical protein